MTVHIQPLSNKNLNLVLRIFNKKDNPNLLYQKREEWKAVCNVSIKPKSTCAWLFAMKGEISRIDYIDIGERLYGMLKVDEVMYERPDKHLVHLRRRSRRRWVPADSPSVSVVAVNFSGFSEE